MLRNRNGTPLAHILAAVDATADGAPRADTVTTGFPSLDKLLGGGFRHGDLIALGGDVGSGKSALALAIALRSAAAGKRVLFLSGDMTVSRVLERVIAIEARARVDDLRQGALEEGTRAIAGALALRAPETMPVIDRLPARRGVASLERLMMAVGGGNRWDCIVLDSMASLAADRRSFAEETASVVRDLKALALDCSVAILTTAPLPSLSTRPDRRPTLDDFGTLGSVKQEADVVLSLYREEMYDGARDIAGATELVVNKNRSGPTGYVDLYFYAQWMRFEDMLDPDH